MQWKSYAVLAPAVVLCVYALALLHEGFLAPRYSGLLTYPFVDDSAALRAYNDLPAPAAVPARQVATRRLLRGDPGNAQSWAAAAYVDWAASDPQAALRDLDRSYALAFFDRQVAVWRVGMALDHWAALTPQLRQAVEDEAVQALKDPALKSPLLRRMRAVRSQEGALAAYLIEAE